jgi:hypothetical protein
VQLRRASTARSLLVVAGDELADEAERDELDADDDEQDAECEQRPVPDASPVSLSAVR